MKKKKLKLKKQAYYIFAGIVVIIVGIILGINYYNDAKYKETMEYKLMEKGYTLEQTKTLQEKLSETELTTILEKEKDDQILDFLNQKYFLFKNLDTYMEYVEEEEETDLAKVVAIVNVHANLKWYEEEYESDTSLNEQMIVNKFYALKEDYTPENISVIPLTYSYGEEGDNVLIDYAYEEFLNLWRAAKEKGYYLMVTSSYRDYASQKEIYDDLKKSQGERAAESIAARPGHSEHQTGLVVDMTSTTAPSGTEFKDSEEYKWLKENAHKYGFIERYPEGKTYLTGYEPESWHWRYVGKEAATVCYEEKITYDEYYAYYIEK